MSLRPTSDRLRETLFNILGDAVRDAVFLDCYAGSGAVGLEALSRGARLAIFIEQSRGALNVLRANIAALGVESQTRVMECSVARGLKRLPAEPQIVFLDPHYKEAEEYLLPLTALRDSQALIVAEHSSKIKMNPPPELAAIRLVHQGDSALTFLRHL